MSVIVIDKIVSECLDTVGYKQAERRRKMFHWFIDGLGSISDLTPGNKLVYESIR